MSSNYKFIDNIPTTPDAFNKKTGTINELIEGYEASNTLDNLGSNEYSNEVNRQQIPIVLKKDKNKDSKNIIAMVANDDDSDDDGDIMPRAPTKKDTDKKPLPKKKNPTDYSDMDLTTQFYVGSITIIGLYILYRFIQKST
jgi:hypothetical protein